MTPLGDMDHQQLVGQLYLLLIGARLPEGCAPLPGVSVVVGTRSLAAPDVAVIDPHLCEGSLGVRPEGLLLAIEITSPSTRTHDLTTKRELYAGWGTPYVVIDRSTDPATPRIFGELVRHDLFT